MLAKLTGRVGRWLFFGGIGLVCLFSSAGAAEDSISAIAARQEPDGITLVLQTGGDKPLQLKALSLTHPFRLVIDISGATLAEPKAQSLTVGGAGISKIRVAQFQVDPGIVRLVCDLSGDKAPPWRQVAGSRPGEILLQFGESRPTPLAIPQLETTPGLIGLRLPGCGALARKIGTLDDPPRFYLDLTGAEATGEGSRDFDEGPIKQVRLGNQHEAGESPLARMVVEFRETQAYVVYPDGRDLIIALGEQPWALPLPEYQGDKRLAGKVFVVDPGHGGHDTGARADCGEAGLLYEKDIALAIGKRLASLLEAERAQVTLTRKDDTYITLAGRAELANRLSADALVSVHCNSCPTPDTLNGTSVYYDHDHSRALAETVQRELLAALGTTDKGVRNANFAVIRKTTGKGILVETAFINHQGDREKLTNNNFQERVARAIVQGLINAFSGDAGPEVCPP